MKEKAFLNENVTDLLLSLASMTKRPSWIAARQAAVARLREETIYDVPGSRVGDNFLSTAYEGCLLGRDTTLVGTSEATDPGRGPNCSCAKPKKTRFWWGASEGHMRAPEVCRCGNGAARPDCRERCPSALSPVRM